MIEYLRQWKNRLKEPTPDFFKPLVKVGVWVGGLGGALLLGGENIPTMIHNAAGYMLAVGSVAGFIAGSAKKDKPEENNK